MKVEKADKDSVNVDLHREYENGAVERRWIITRCNLINSARKKGGGGLTST